MLITTGYNFEGYTITSYINIISESVVIGTGFASSVSVNLADITGGKSNMYSDKMQRGKDIALYKLKEQAKSIGGNGIIGVDIDYTTFANDVMGVVVNGTVVKIKPKKKSDSHTYSFPSMVYNINLPFNVCGFNLTRNYYTKATTGNLLLINYVDGFSVTAIISDIEFEDVFGNKQSLSDIVFISKSYDNREVLESETAELPLENIQINLIKKIYVNVKKYILNDNDKIICAEENTNKISLTVNELMDLRKAHGEDVVSKCQSINEKEIICYCGAINKNETNICHRCGRELNNMKQKIITSNAIQKIDYAKFLYEIDNLKNAKEIYDYLISLNLPELTELINEIQKLATSERLYGNMKDSALAKIRKVID